MDQTETETNGEPQTETDRLAALYPHYFPPIPPGQKYLDTYLIGILFPTRDDSGALDHARKKLLVPGGRGGRKDKREDVIEARNSLNRWLDLNP